MREALERGERYEAALLDSEHSADHVWAEFELARQLVCNGGLILIHDALWEHGSVEGALQRIRDAGFGVVRLWAAESGVREDDRLGLAVVENRRQPRQRVETD
jgi:cephalosporin hydroxylase